jgi:hypothetical protein
MKNIYKLPNSNSSKILDLNIFHLIKNSMRGNKKI